MLVPLVEATEVPLVKGYRSPLAFVAIVPETEGSVTVTVPAIAGASSVTCPLVLPLITTELIIYPYRTTQRLPLGTVTVTPDASVIGPVVDAF